jgi:S1-C subfamily serine protease
LTVAVFAAGVGAVLAGGGALAAGGLRTHVRTVAVPAVEQRVEQVTVVMPGGHKPPPMDVVAIAQRVRPTIVGLQVQGAKAGPPSAASVGSGVMFRSDGYVLTDARVVAGATALIAVLADARRITARVLGTDSETGVSVVKLAGSGYEVAALGSTDDVQVGQRAVAIGATPTTNGVPDVSVATVQGVGRSVENDAGRQLAGMIETDAHLGAGAWGGALVDANAVVIGITAAPRSPNMGGLATPIDVAYAVGAQLISAGKVGHVWLGINGQDLDAATAAFIGVPGGALVDGVLEASPAAACGLAAGDVITSVNERAVASMASLMVALRVHSPGERVFVHLRRGPDTLALPAVLAERPLTSA